MRSRIEGGWRDPAAFRDELLAVPPRDRDAWVDRVLGLGELPDDEPLPRDCVPYLPCSVDALLRVVEHAPVGASDVFVDIGAGLGRAAAVVHLLSGATALGVELQPRLAATARRLPVQVIQGEAAALAGTFAHGSVFFLYCPFSGPRLAKVLAELERIAQTRAIRVCCVDVPLPPCAWLAADDPRGDLAIYRSAAVPSTA